MAKQTKKQADEVLVDIVEVRDQAQDYFEKHRKPILGIGGGLLLLIVGFLAYKFLFLAPRERQASEQITQAQKQFERDSFALALTNPGGGYEGFLNIIKNYGGTRTANLAHYYAGISYLNLGKFDAAVSYLEDFNAKGSVMPIMKYGALGDAYSELKQMDKARNSYEKAVAQGPNDAVTPFYLKRLAMLCERDKDYAQAREYYEQIKEEFPNSLEASDVEKYLARLEGK